MRHDRIFMYVVKSFARERLWAWFRMLQQRLNTDTETSIACDFYIHTVDAYAWAKWAFASWLAAEQSNVDFIGILYIQLI